MESISFTAGRSPVGGLHAVFAGRWMPVAQPRRYEISRDFLLPHACVLICSPSSMGENHEMISAC